MTGFQHLFVSPGDLDLEVPEGALEEYRFNTGRARHLFCRICGIKAFYVPRSHPDGFSVNLRCVELPQNALVDFHRFDGRNWETNIQRLVPDKKI